MKNFLLCFIFILPLTTEANADLLRLLFNSNVGNNVNTQETMELLNATSELLETVDEMLPEVQNTDEHVAENDLFPEECQDVPVEELVCDEDDGIDYDVCYDEYDVINSQMK